ncbi:ATP-dependent helicase [Corynebacterium uterequi]|uniref:DNA 3'-5' helicase n=1 Tax=Corynebacterium uterequi TaxID=1072256 RepID=A0A0G3HCV2_9CORY|nr:ATP-dependent DNA helicase UvrD2 [Corynebacterium uterequi]AKK10550.1 DNA/RNA helicase, superfamily I [Corynebacterium uterequi]
MIDLDALDPDQRVAATAPRGPVCILAGAGTGKTRTITYRIAHLVDAGFVSQHQVLAVTFTRRAAGEMRERINRLGIGGVNVQTFNAAASHQLRYFWPHIGGAVPWQYLSNSWELVRDVARGMKLNPTRENIRDLRDEIDWAKATLLTPDTYPAAVDAYHRTPPFSAAAVAEAYRRYERLKSTPEKILLDFSDTMLHMAGALESIPAVAEEFRSRYRCFVVDEYQDVTPLQQRLLEGWLGDRDDLTVVGDANQTIFSFTGASPEYLLNFSRTYPNAAVVKLQRDYRSTPQVTELANDVIGRARGRAAGTRLSLQGMRAPGPNPSFHGYPDEETEAREVASRVQQLIDDGVPAREIAILYRINGQSAVFEQALDDAGIVYQVRGGERFFARRDVSQALRHLAEASRRTDLPDDPVAIARAALIPLGLTPEQPQGVQARERWQMLKALVDLVEQLVRDRPGIDIRGVVAVLEQRRKDGNPPSVDGVTLASLHASKGLEWDAVFLTGLFESMVPYRQAIDAGEGHIEEERRLFYVGVTRAREHLFLSWSQARHSGGQPRSRTRFLDGIVPDDQPANATGRAKRARRCSVCTLPLNSPAERVLGRHESCPSGMDVEVFKALRAWRADVAKADGVPAFVVFSDATLTAIAEAMPTTIEQLLSISGIGQVKVQRYGEDLLGVLAPFA